MKRVQILQHFDPTSKSALFLLYGENLKGALIQSVEVIVCKL